VFTVLDHWKTAITSYRICIILSVFGYKIVGCFFLNFSGGGCSCSKSDVHIVPELVVGLLCVTVLQCVVNGCVQCNAVASSAAALSQWCTSAVSHITCSWRAPRLDQCKMLLSLMTKTAHIILYILPSSVVCIYLKLQVCPLKTSPKSN